MYPTAIYKIIIDTEKIISAIPIIFISSTPSTKKNSPNIKAKNKVTEMYEINLLNYLRI